VRVLHSLSFVDDPTRMLRAVRFEQRFGFALEERTLELLWEARPLLGRVSGDRVRHELDHVLAEESACEMMARLEQLDLLIAIHRELKWDDWLCNRLMEARRAAVSPELGLEETAEMRQALQRSLVYILWLLRLPATRARSVINRLKLSNELAGAILAARRLWRELQDLAGGPPSAIADRLRKVPPLALYAVFLASADQDQRDLLWNYVARWQHVSPTIDGHALRARGLPPGPVYRQILGALRDAWLDGKISTAEEEAVFVERMLEEQGIGD
jgi:tRNA nucleotidyltransferase (CCA-adding enzyme)